MEQEAKTAILTQKKVAGRKGSNKINVIKSIMAVLPEILLELIPLIIEKSEALINENITKGLEICRRNLPDILNINKKVNSFIRRNNDHWQNEFEERKDIYYKFTRTDQLILLHIECLEKKPIYIPRKFRYDNTFTINKQEKTIYFKLDRTKLKTKMEILTTRREYFRKKTGRNRSGIYSFYRERINLRSS